MHEKCDCCGQEFEVLVIVFTGQQYLCPQCYAQGWGGAKIAAATQFGG